MRKRQRRRVQKMKQQQTHFVIQSMRNTCIHQVKYMRFTQCFLLTEPKLMVIEKNKKDFWTTSALRAFLLSVKSDTLQTLPDSNTHTHIHSRTHAAYAHFGVYVYVQYAVDWSNKKSALKRETHTHTVWLNGFFTVWKWTLAENMIRIDILRSHHHSLFVLYLL